MELYKYSTCDMKDFEGLNIQNPNGARELKENSSSLNTSSEPFVQLEKNCTVWKSF